MIIQIGGIVILTTSIICFTWWMTANKAQADKERRNARKERQARNDRIFNNEALSLYEEEKQRRIAAETKCGILQTQLDRARETMAKIPIREVR